MVPLFQGSSARREERADEAGVGGSPSISDHGSISTEGGGIRP
jgi:hypothetical protein